MGFPILVRCHLNIESGPRFPTWLFTWAPFQYPIRRLIGRSRKVSKPQDLYFELSDQSEIWQAPWQHCCQCACKVLKQCDNINCQSRGFETSRDLIEYWNETLIYWFTDFHETMQIWTIIFRTHGKNGLKFWTCSADFPNFGEIL